jgi:hypothetical protein
MSMFTYTRTAHLRSFINWELVSTPSMGHHQAIMQGYACLQKLSTLWQEISVFHIKKTLKIYVQPIKVQPIAKSLSTLKNCVTAFKNAKCKKVLYRSTIRSCFFVSQLRYFLKDVIKNRCTLRVACYR